MAASISSRSIYARQLYKDHHQLTRAFVLCVEQFHRWGWLYGGHTGVWWPDRLCAIAPADEMGDGSYAVHSGSLNVPTGIAAAVTLQELPGTRTAQYLFGVDHCAYWVVFAFFGVDAGELFPHTSGRNRRSRKNGRYGFSAYFPACCGAIVMAWLRGHRVDCFHFLLE